MYKMEFLKRGEEGKKEGNAGQHTFCVDHVDFSEPITKA
jgi:hypothetical protein